MNSNFEFDLDDTFASFFGDSATCEKCGKTILSDTMEQKCLCETAVAVDEEFERRNAAMNAFDDPSNDRE